MPNETPKPHTPKIFHMDANGNLVEGAPDSATLHAMLQAKLAEESKATGVAPKAEAPAATPAAGAKKDLKRRFGPGGKTDTEIEDEAVTGTMRGAIDKGIKDADKDGM